MELFIRFLVVTIIAAVVEYLLEFIPYLPIRRVAQVLIFAAYLIWVIITFLPKIL